MRSLTKLKIKWLKRRAYYLGIQIIDMFRVGICPNCGKNTWLKWHAPFCNNECFHQAMEYSIKLELKKQQLKEK